ncbi:MAG TPA: alpha/beta fold hydrolase [Actinomycetota bacterium]
MEGFAPVEGGRLYYEVRGEGPSIVLIHAGLWDSRIWDDQMGAFAQRYRTVRYDLRGFGRSDRLTIPFSLRQDLTDLLAFLRIPSAALVACSIGGSLAIDFTLERPDMVDALVLVAPGLSGDDTPDDERTARLMKEAEQALETGQLEKLVDLQLQAWTPPANNPEVDRRIREIAMDNKHVDTLDWSLSRRLDPPAAGRLSEIHVPTLVILGDRDAPVMEVIVEKVASGIHGARKALIQDADHLPNMRQPDRFNQEVLAFLAEALHRA